MISQDHGGDGILPVYLQILGIDLIIGHNRWFDSWCYQAEDESLQEMLHISRNPLTRLKIMKKCVNNWHSNATMIQFGHFECPIESVRSMLE